MFPIEYQRALKEAADEEEALKKAQTPKAEILVNGVANGGGHLLGIPNTGMHRISSLSNVYGEDMINKLQDEDVSCLICFNTIIITFMFFLLFLVLLVPRIYQLFL